MEENSENVESILGKKLLIIVAHPDDESFLAAGTIHANHLARGENYIFCASLGERGHNYLGGDLSCEEVKAMRRGELVAVSNFLGIDSLEIADLPDGSMSNERHKLQNCMRSVVDKINPDYVVSFGEDGYTGHADHIIVGEIAKSIAKDSKIPFVKFAKPPRRACGGIEEHLVAKRKNGVYALECEMDILPNIEIKINPEIKLKALSLHESQFDGLNPHKIFPADIALNILNYEYFCITKF